MMKIDLDKASKLWAKPHMSATAIAKSFGISERSLKRIRDANPSLFPAREPTKPDRARNLKVFKRLEEELKEVVIASVREDKRNRKVKTVGYRPEWPNPKGEAKEYDAERLAVARPLHELTKRCCSWPLNDGSPYLFCGEVKSSKNYCSAHEERAWRAR